MKEERLICATAPELSHVTEHCLKAKLQIYTAPRNRTYTLLAAALIHCPNVRQSLRAQLAQ
jgi:hypothetical protein